MGCRRAVHRNEVGSCASPRVRGGLSFGCVDTLDRWEGMNRRERRASQKRQQESAGKPEVRAALAGLGLADLMPEAGCLRTARRIGDAQALCREILAREPAHVPTLNLLGLMAQA